MPTTRLTWPTVEAPILAAIADLSAVTGLVKSSNLIVQALGLDDLVVHTALRRLDRAGYISAVQWIGNQEGSQLAVHVRLEERGLVEVGIWPSEDVGMSFLAALSAEIEQETDPVKKSRLEKLRDGFLGVGGQVVAGLIVEAVKRGTFGP